MIFLSKLAHRLALLKNASVVLLAVSAGCRVDAAVSNPDPSDSTTAPSVASIAVSPASDSSPVGSSVQFTATLTNKRGDTLQGIAVTWAVEDTAVAQVDSTGLVTYQSLGSTDVLASASGTSGRGHISSRPPRVWAVTVSPSQLTLMPGDAATLTATALARSGSVITGKTATWRSSTPGAVTVDATGTIVAVAQGGAVITATIDGKDGTATINVQATPVQDVIVTPDTAMAPLGASVRFQAVATDANGAPLTGRTFVWRSSNPAIASVSADGVATGLTAGYAAISATAEGVSDTATMTVSGPVTPVPTVIALRDGNGQSAQVGTALAVAPSVIVTDQFNHPIQGAAVAFAVTGGGGSITGATQVTGSDGVARVGSWTLGSTTGTNTLAARSDGLTGSPVTFTAAATAPPPPPPPGSTDVYFNSSEAGCSRLDAGSLFCDDFESGFWYTVDADHVSTTGGGPAAQKGWYGTIYSNPITPAGAAVCSSRGFRSSCAATSGYLDGTIGGTNMAEHGFVDGRQVNEAWFRLYFQPQADYDGGHEKMFDFTRGAPTAQMVALCYNYFGSETIRCIPYLHQDDGLPAPAVNAWMGSNMAADVRLLPTHWYFIEMHVRLNTPGAYDGVFEYWLNDCGTDGSACTGTPTLRGRYTNVLYRNATTEATVTLGGIWIENWANPASRGTLLYDNMRASQAGPIGFAR